MISAFGVDHGEFSKAFNPIKAVKAIPGKSRAKNYQRGFNQQMTAHGEMSGKPVGGTLGAAWMKRSHESYAAGQGAGRKYAQSKKNPQASPFR